MAAQNILATNSNAYTIPLIPQNQEFDISLNGVTYHLRVKWNSFSAAWILYIEDSQRNPILSGLPLVTGCDLLEQFEYLGFGGAMVVQSTTDPDLVPNYASLGSTGNLFFIIPAATAVN
jgi:hypothetical protein